MDTSPGTQRVSEVRSRLMVWRKTLKLKALPCPLSVKRWVNPPHPIGQKAFMKATRLIHLLLYIGTASAASDRFARDLVSKANSDQVGSYVISPISAQQAISMVALGASGTTRQEMDRVLGFPSDTADRNRRIQQVQDAISKVSMGGSVALEVANRVWIERSFPVKPSFRTEVERMFDSGIATGDFRTRADSCRGEINRWVEAKTHQRIRDLLPTGAVDASTRMVLVNAVYFRGEWDVPFEPGKTQRSRFSSSDQKSFQVPMMQQTASLPYREETGLQICALAYRGRGLSMVILLPELDGVHGLEERIAKEGIDTVIGQLESRRVEIFLPRFKVESAFELPEMLKTMGMRSVFDDESADLSGISTNRLSVSRVIQKASVEVREEGTEAAAATSVLALEAPAPPSEKAVVFRADHPFLFVLREDSSGLILFAGRFSVPSR